MEQLENENKEKISAEALTEAREETNDPELKEESKNSLPTNHAAQDASENHNGLSKENLIANEKGKYISFWEGKFFKSIQPK